MAKPRPCGCKGIRSCLICEEEYGMTKREEPTLCSGGKNFVYCPLCNKAWPGWEVDDWKKHPDHSGEPIDYPGVYIELDFLSEEEEATVMKATDEMPWELSQSGRRKINFGPKCNFKKRKLQLGTFDGFPLFSKFIQERFESVPILKGYRTVEQCALDYPPEKGASIDPHIDDCWVWGERIVTVSMVVDCILTMTKYTGTKDKYNLKDIDGYYKYNCARNEGEVIRIPMPCRSLLVLYGPARYEWEHCILRDDVKERRVCLAYRELTPPFLEGGKKWGIGKEIVEKAKKIWDHKEQFGIKSLD